jgi:pyrroloquinoline quinone biosynthesis protein B
VSVDPRQWFLFNASPDLRTQIEDFPGLRPDRDRVTPLAAVLLTDAELDHTLGLLLLREATGLRLYSTSTVYKTLQDGSGVLSLLQRYCPVQWQLVLPGARLALADGLSGYAFDLPTDKPDRFGLGLEHGRVVGYRLTDERTGGTLVYLPGMPAITPGLRAHLEDCACLLVDGTCWSDDELVRSGLSAKTSRAMGHLPISGPGGSLEQLAGMTAKRTIFVHLNNPNPVLLADSPERRRVEDSGMDVAHDGLEVEV